jgi:hypothetical protein
VPAGRRPREKRLILVRFLLFLALATVAVSALLYVIKRDRRYLRFIVQVVLIHIFIFIKKGRSTAISEEAHLFQRSFGSFCLNRLTFFAHRTQSSACVTPANVA